MNTIIVLCAILGSAISAPSGGYATQPAYAPTVQLVNVNQAKLPLYQIRVPVQQQQQYFQPAYEAHAHQQPAIVEHVKTAPVITGSLHLAQDTHGQYKYGYSSSDGQEKSEARESDGATDGQFSYTSPEGLYIQLNYEADKDGGFRASGDHLPVAPELPPELAAAYKESYDRLAQAYEEARLRGDTEDSEDGSYKGEKDGGDQEEEEKKGGEEEEEKKGGEEEEEEEEEEQSEGGDEGKKDEHKSPSAPSTPFYHTYVRPAVSAPVVQYRPAIQAPAVHYRPVVQAPAVHYRPVVQAPAIHYRPVTQAPAVHYIKPIQTPIQTYYISSPVSQAPAPVQTYYVSAPAHSSYAPAPAKEEKKEKHEEQKHEEEEEEEAAKGPIPYLSSSYSTEIGGTPVASVVKSVAPSAHSKAAYY